MSLRFHWMLPKGGEVAVDAAQTPQEAARKVAERAGKMAETYEPSSHTSPR